MDVGTALREKFIFAAEQKYIIALVVSNGIFKGIFKPLQILRSLLDTRT
jgi:hypothetical protein